MNWHYEMREIFFAQYLKCKKYFISFDNVENVQIRIKETLKYIENNKKSES